MIDQIRHELQARLDELLSEVDKLRHALVALGSGEKPWSSDRPGGSRRGRPAPAASPKRTSQTAPRSSARRAESAPGATKTAILGALQSGRGDDR